MKSVKKMPHYLIAGAGYAGLPLAIRLNRIAKGQCRISLVSPDTKQELTCDLYRTLRNGKAYTFPFLKTLKHAGINFIEGHVHGIDPDKNKVMLRAQSRTDLHYDKLILTAGLRLKTPSIEGLQEFLEHDRESMRKRIFSFKKTNHAQTLRLAMSRIGWGSEKTSNDKDTFVVVLGAGSTGLEVAGELANLRGKNPRDRIILIDENKNILSDFSPVAGKLLNKKLRKLGVETVLGSPVKKITDSEIHLSSGQVVPWEILVLCTGNVAAPTWAEGINKNEFENGFKVDSQFKLTEFSNIYALGDLARYSMKSSPQKILPKRAQFAYQASAFLADEFLANLKGKEFSNNTFKGSDYGYLISLGPKDGIARLGPQMHSQFGKFFSPYFQGQKVDQIKRFIRLNYLAQLKSQRFRI